MVAVLPRTTVSVSPRALITRINRKLKSEGQILRTSRTARAVQAVGPFYVVDLQRKVVHATHVDIDAMARELGVLKPWEHIETAEKPA